MGDAVRAAGRETRDYPHHARDRAAGDRRRAQLLDAAIAELAASGWHATSVRSIADRAGMQPSGVLHHFPNKAALLLAALEHADAEARELLEAAAGQPEPTGAAALDGILAVLRLYTERPALARLSIAVAQEAVAADHPAADWARTRRRAIRASLESALAAPDAGLADDLDVAREAAGLFALIEGAVAHWLSDPDHLDPVAVVAHHLDRLRAG